jgi:hypoxanthine phosphoribosyltransferase
MQSSPIDVRERPAYAVDQFSTKPEYEGLLDEILLPEGEIENRIHRLADEISREYERRASDHLYAVCVLKGAMRYFDALVTDLSVPGRLTEGIVRASRYTGGTGAETEINYLEADMIAGTDVLVVEDIVDEGVTLEKVREELAEYDPNSIRATALFEKRARLRTDVDIEHTGFVIPDEFVVGYGLDYDERFRDVRHLATVDETALEE